MQTISFLKRYCTGILAVLLFAVPVAVYGQGSVSSAVSGSILDEAGLPVPGATVTATHVPTNTVYTAVTGPSGRFSFTGLRVGGPYRIAATGADHEIGSIQDVYAALGDDTVVMLPARSKVVQLERFVTTASTNDLNASATGAGSVLSAQAIENQPTTTRSFADLIKTNPFATIRAFPQVTALGMNYRYNSITLDGARLNDQFGLAGAGLVALKNPFSLDAIENFSVSLTPYDVTQSGFAGASINAVSKSGTNQFSGSAYYIYTSSKWQGEDLSGTNEGRRPSQFYERTWGATLGGPIIKNRLFFFLNYEEFNNPSGSPTNAGFSPDSSALASIQNQMSALPGGSDLGAFGSGPPSLLTDEKVLAKLDWNITADHRLTVRYSTTEGTQPFSPNFNSTGLSNPLPAGVSTSGYSNGVTSFSSNFYDLAVEEEVWATQLFSAWSPNFKTELAFSKNDTTSGRSTPINFPQVIIRNVPTSSGANTGTALLFGTDVSSMGNGIISEQMGYSANASYTWRNLAFKAGFDHEETDFENLFRNGSYGVFAYDYSPTLNLANDRPVGFVRGVSSAGFPGTDVSRLEQTGYFVQAKWEPTQRLNLTFGLRYDEMGSPIAPTFNPAFSSAFGSLFPGIRNDGTIDGTSRLAPRLSFNYAVDQDRKVQIRGGAGVFLGRNPWVWISNSYGNAGFGRFNLSRPSATSPTLAQYLNGTFSETDTAFVFDPENPRGSTALPATAGGAVSVNFIEPGLKLPTNLRGNLAVDVRIDKLDATFSVEYIRTTVMEAMFYDNINLRVRNGDAQNRPTDASYGVDGRLRFAGSAASAPLISGFGNVLRLRNVDAGSTDYVAFTLDRPFKNGWAYNVSYTRGRATEAQPAGSSTAGSNWGFNVVFNQGAIEEVRSDYEIRDRIQASISKEFSFFDRYKTTATLYYEGRSGQPFSYVYSGDLNSDGNNANDVFFVPTGLDDPRFNFASMTTAQQAAYFDFIESSGLDAYAGTYVPRNAFIGPWQNRLDLQVTQQVKVAGPVLVEVFADFINFGSWLSEDLFNYVETFGPSTTNSNQSRVLGNASYGADGRLTPTVSLNPDGSIVLPANSRLTPNNSDARWRIQAGVRLKF